MRRVPFGIRGVAEESAADVIAQTACRHLIEGETQKFGQSGIRLLSLPLKQGVHLRRHGEFTDLAEATMQGIRFLPCPGHKPLPCDFDACSTERCAGGQLCRRWSGLPGEAADTRLVRCPASGKLGQQFAKVIRRCIQHNKRRVAVGGDKGIQGPACHAIELCREGLQSVVEAAIEFAVDLDRNEITIEQRSDLRILVAFALHDVTPVTGEVAHRNEQQLVFAPGAGEGVGIPLLPGNRVMPMQRQIRRRMVCKLIGRIGRPRRNGHHETQQQDCNACPVFKPGHRSSLAGAG